MATKAKAIIEVDVETEKAEQGLKGLTKAFDASFVGINAALELGAKAFNLFTGAVGGLASQIGELVELSEAQVKAENNAIASLKLRGKFTDENFRSLQKFNSAIQQSIGIGDEQLLQVEALLANFGVMPEAIETNVKNVLALNEVLGGTSGLEDIAKNVAKALDGDVGSLKEYGINVDNVADAQEELNRLFRLAETNSRTLGTRIKVLEANFGDLEEVLGDTVSQSGALKGGLDAFSDAFVELQNVFSGPKGREAVNSFFQLILTGISKSIDALIEMQNMVSNLFGGETTGKLGGTLGFIPDEIAIQLGLSPEDRNLIQAVAAGRLRQAAVEAVSGQAVQPGARGGRFFGLSDEQVERFKRLEAQFQQIGEETGSFGREIQSVLRNLQATLEEAATAGVTERGARAGAAGAPGRTRVAGETAAGFDLQQRLNVIDLMQGRQTTGGGVLDTGALFAPLQPALEPISGQFEEMNSGVVLLTESFGLLEDAVDNTAAGVSDSFSQIFISVAEGSATVGDAIGGFIGSVLTQIGTMLIQLGTAAVLAGTIGTIIPIFAGLTGGPAGVGAGIAAIAGGTAMVALGSALGGSGGGGGAPAASRPAGGAPRRGFAPSQPIATGQVGALQQVVVFNRPIMGGSPRRVARDVEDTLNRGRQLSAAGA